MIINLFQNIKVMFILIILSFKIESEDYLSHIQTIIKSETNF